jgi:transcriptional regulator with XRE-family HTH domain
MRIKVFGANVRRERMRINMTQDKLAGRAKIATRNLQMIEAGKLNILNTTAFRIQLALRCSPEALAPAK